MPDAYVADVLSTADVGLCPDPLNPLNDVSTMNKTMEYMAFGLPVVAFDLVETRVSADDAAVYVDPASGRGGLRRDPACTCSTTRTARSHDGEPPGANGRAHGLPGSTSPRRTVAVFDELTGSAAFPRRARA